MTFVAQVFYELVAVATLWLAWFWICARSGRPASSWLAKLSLGVTAALICFIPVNGLPLWRWVFSVHPNPSLPLSGMIAVALWQRLFGTSFFQPRDRGAVWVLGAVAGTALYLHTTYFGAIDLYYWGWERNAAVACLAIGAVTFLVAGNRLGVLLLAALAAYAVGALESANAWDYVVDPFYWLISLGALASRGIRWCLARRRVAS